MPNVIKKKADRLPYLLILPSVILIVGMIIYPLIDVFRYSLMDFNSARPSAAEFVGMENYKDLFSGDRVFTLVLRNSLKWVVTEVTLQLICGLSLALLLNKHFPFRGVFRTVLFIPWAISGVLTATIWSLLYNQHIGFLSDVLLNLGFADTRIAWLADINTVFPAVIAAELWRGIPFFTVSILAALQNIPDDIYEACRIDGANSWQIFCRITLPYLKDTIVLTTLLRCVWEFNSVDLIYNLTSGGPARMTTTLSLYIMQQAIQTGKYSYGATLSVISFLILLVFAAIYLKLSRFSEED